jgi:hypothetical protein
MRAGGGAVVETWAQRTAGCGSQSASSNTFKRSVGGGAKQESAVQKRIRELQWNPNNAR